MKLTDVFDSNFEGKNITPIGIKDEIHSIYKKENIYVMEFERRGDLYYIETPPEEDEEVKGLISHDFFTTYEVNINQKDYRLTNSYLESSRVEIFRGKLEDEEYRYLNGYVDTIVYAIREPEGGERIIVQDVIRCRGRFVADFKVNGTYLIS